MAWRKKNKKDVPVVQMSEEDIEAVEEHVAALIKTQLPLGRVKKLVRLNPDVEMVNSEAIQMMTKAAELFVKELSSAANYNAALEKRKTIQTKDIDKAIKKNWAFAFLEDALDGWPKMEPKKRKVGGNGEQGESQQDTLLEETIVEEAGDTADDDEEEELPETVPEKEFAENRQDTPVKDPFAEQF